MSTDLTREVATRELARLEAEWGTGYHDLATVHRGVSPIVADVLDLLTQHGRVSAPVDPGPCWADSGIVWPGRNFSTRCDLRAGHLGAHEADRGSMGGTAVWTDANRAQPAPHNEPAASAAGMEDES